MPTGDEYEIPHDRAKLNCLYRSARVGKLVVGLMRVGNVRTWCFTQEVIGATDDEARTHNQAAVSLLSAMDVISKHVLRREQEDTYSNDDLVRSLRAIADTITISSEEEEGNPRLLARAIAEDLANSDIIRADIMRRLGELITGDAALQRDLRRIRATDMSSTIAAMRRAMVRKVSEVIPTEDGDLRNSIFETSESLVIDDIIKRDLLRRTTPESLAYADLYARAVVRKTQEDMELSAIQRRFLIRLIREEILGEDRLFRDTLRTRADDIFSDDQTASKMMRLTDEAFDTEDALTARDMIRILDETQTWAVENDRDLIRLRSEVVVPADDDSLKLIASRTEDLVGADVLHRDFIRTLSEDTAILDGLTRQAIRLRQQVMTAVGTRTRDLLRRRSEDNFHFDKRERDLIRRIDEDLTAQDAESFSLIRLLGEAATIGNDDLLRDLIRICGQVMGHTDDDQFQAITTFTEALTGGDDRKRDLLRRRIASISRLDAATKNPLRRAAEESTVAQNEDLIRKFFRIVEEESTFLPEIQRDLIRRNAFTLFLLDSESIGGTTVRTEQMFADDTHTREMLRRTLETAVFAASGTRDVSRRSEESIDASDLLMRRLIRMVEQMLTATSDLARDAIRAEFESILPEDGLARDLTRLIEESLLSADVITRALVRARQELVSGTDQDMRSEIRTLIESITTLEEPYFRDLIGPKFEDLATSDAHKRDAIHLREEQSEADDATTRAFLRTTDPETFASADALARAVVRRAQQFFTLLDTDSRAFIGIREESVTAALQVLRDLNRQIDEGVAFENSALFRDIMRLAAQAASATDTDARAEVFIRTESATVASDDESQRDLIRRLIEDVSLIDSASSSPLRVFEEFLESSDDRERDLIRLTEDSVAATAFFARALDRRSDFNLLSSDGDLRHTIRLLVESLSNLDSNSKLPLRITESESFEGSDDIIERDVVRTVEETLPAVDATQRQKSRTTWEDLSGSDNSLLDLLRLTQQLISADDDDSTTRIAITQESMQQADQVLRNLIRATEEDATFMASVQKALMRCTVEDIFALSRSFVIRDILDEDQVLCAAFMLAYFADTFGTNDLHGPVMDELLTRVKTFRGTL